MSVKPEITLDSIFEDYQKEEFVSKENGLQCGINGNNEEYPWYKQIKLKNPDDSYTPPDDLIFSLSRFSYTSSASKIDTLVDIPDDLELYKEKYKLTAVIIHVGLGSKSGHYYTIVKDKDNNWIRLDDSTKSPINSGDNNIKELIKRGYIFLYKNESITNTIDIGERNGIANIRNSCYFNSLLQLLISTDEYLNKSKMEINRPKLYDFLTNCTKVTNGINYNDGMFLKTFNTNDIKSDNILDTIYDNKEDTTIIRKLNSEKKDYVIINIKEKGKKYSKLFELNNNSLVDNGYAGVSVFGNSANRLSVGCQEDATEALNLLLENNDIFKYSDNTEFYCIENTTPPITYSYSQIKNNLDIIQYTTNPPFFRYFKQEIREIKDHGCPRKTKNYEINTLLFPIPQSSSSTLTSSTPTSSTPTSSPPPTTTNNNKNQQQPKQSSPTSSPKLTRRNLVYNNITNSNSVLLPQVTQEQKQQKLELIETLQEFINPTTEDNKIEFEEILPTIFEKVKQFVFMENEKQQLQIQQGGGSGSAIFDPNLIDQIIQYEQMTKSMLQLVIKNQETVINMRKNVKGGINISKNVKDIEDEVYMVIQQIVRLILNIFKNRYDTNTIYKPLQKQSQTQQQQPQQQTQTQQTQQQQQQTQQQAQQQLLQQQQQQQQKESPLDDQKQLKQEVKNSIQELQNSIQPTSDFQATTDTFIKQLNVLQKYDITQLDETKKQKIQTIIDTRKQKYIEHINQFDLSKQQNLISVQNLIKTFTDIKKLLDNSSQSTKIQPSTQSSNKVKIKGGSVEIQLPEIKSTRNPHITVCYITPDTKIEYSVRNDIIQELEKYKKGKRTYKFKEKWGKDSFLITGDFETLQKDLFNIIHTRAPDIIKKSNYPDTNGRPYTHIDTKGNEKTAKQRDKQETEYTLDYTAFDIIT